MFIKILLALAILPSFIVIFWIYRQDRYEKEPFSLLFKAFVIGCASTIPAMLMQIQFQGWQNEDSLWDTAIYAFLVVGISEELSKFVFLRLFIYPMDEFNEPMDGIVYAVMVGMGFATVENMLYIFESGGEGRISTAIGRGLTAVPAHAAFAILMGSYMGLSKFVTERKYFYLFLGLGLAVFFHGLYDFFLLQKVYEGLGALAIGALIWGASAAWHLVKFGQELSPFRPDIVDVGNPDSFGKEGETPIFSLADHAKNVEIEENAVVDDTKDDEEPPIKNEDLI